MDPNKAAVALANKLVRIWLGCVVPRTTLQRRLAKRKARLTAGVISKV
jgi:hypothetical protein